MGQAIQSLSGRITIGTGVAREVAIEQFQAKVAEKVKAGATVENAQREVAAEEPELFAAIRSTPNPDDVAVSRAIASGALLHVAQDIAKRDGVEFDEAVRRAAVEHPKLAENYQHPEQFAGAETSPKAPPLSRLAKLRGLYGLPFDATLEQVLEGVRKVEEEAAAAAKVKPAGGFAK